MSSNTTKCKGCKRNEAVEEGFCEYCIVYERDPDKDNPLPHLFEYKGEKHYIFNFKKIQEYKLYPIGEFYIRKHKNGIEYYTAKEDVNNETKH